MKLWLTYIVQSSNLAKGSVTVDGHSAYPTESAESWAVAELGVCQDLVP